MAQAYDRIKAAIQNAADSIGSLTKIVLGDPDGTTLKYPEEPWGRIYSVGALWGTIVIPQILAKVGAEIDRCGACWCQVDTKATGQSPAYEDKEGFDTVTKTEISDRLNLTLDPAFSNTYYHVSATCLEENFNCRVTKTSASAFYLVFHDMDGNNVTINDRKISIACFGSM